MPPSTQQQVLQQLNQLVGLKLSASRRAADMRTLQFGTLRPYKRGSVGDFALHVQCPWRVEDRDGIITGRADLYEPVERGPDFDWENWDHEQSPNLQDLRFEQLLADREAAMVVRGVEADDHGGAAIRFAEALALRLFPSGSRSEAWRLFRPGSSSHFVVGGGEVEVNDDASSRE